jgi:hypothetical protein
MSGLAQEILEYVNLRPARLMLVPDRVKTDCSLFAISTPNENGKTVYKLEYYVDEESFRGGQAIGELSFANANFASFLSLVMKGLPVTCTLNLYLPSDRRHVLVDWKFTGNERKKDILESIMKVMASAE